MDVKKHPTVNKLINQFILEQKNTDLLKAQIYLGKMFEQNKVNAKRDINIKS
jgi:hypothetical protein